MMSLDTDLEEIYNWKTQPVVDGFNMGPQTMLKIKITFQTRYNGCTVESSNQDVNESLEDAIPSITHDLCEEDGEWYMSHIPQETDEEIRSKISTLVTSYELEYEYDEYSS